MKKRISLLLVCALALTCCLSIFAGAQKDVESAISLPAALILGHTYDLQIQEGTLALNGEPCDGTFVAAGSQAVLTYADPSGNKIAEYTLPVVDTKDAADHCAYFYDQSGAVAKVENENNIALSFAKDSTVAFLTKLDSQDLAMYFSIDENKMQFETMKLTLTSAENAQVKLTFLVNIAEKTLSLGNQKVELADLNDIVQLRYKDSSQKLMLGNDTELLVCEKDDNKQEFSGFGCGVYLTAEFTGVSGDCTVNMTRMGNHPLGHKNSTSPDMTEPTVAFSNAIPSTMLMDEQFQFPTYEAYDVLSPVAESAVTVEAPDGTVYTESFTVSQYGKYKLTCVAKDSCGNQAKTIRMIYVNDDVAPELSVSPLEKDSYKVGDAVKLPSYTVSDNLDVYTVDAILFLPNGEIRMLTSDANGEITYCLTDTALYNTSFICDNSSFKAEQSGKYTLRYVAYDDQYNRVVQELSFEVK